MSAVFAKLNGKEHKQNVVLDSPGSFESELAALKSFEVIRDLKKANEVTFSLAFVTTAEQIKCPGSRDAWPRSFEPDRMVAIDEDWSAKRFRRAGFIKNMTRPKEYRLTEPAKARPAKAPPG